MGLLTATTVRGLTAPGQYRDGDGLFLHVSKAGKRHWIYRYQRQGRAREMTLGPADVVSLADARKRHTEARAALAKGLDPLDARQQDAQRTVSFSAAAEAYIAAHRAGWRGSSERHWRGDLGNHALPLIGGTPVDRIDVGDVLRVLTPLWTTRTVTATILRSRLELLLDYATAMGWRPAGVANPARWRGHLRSLLPPPAKVHRVAHWAALPWREAPALLASLSGASNMAAQCLRFLILTAVRSAEARGCRWDEIDMANAVWTIPAARMKGGRAAYRVPLSEPALDILRKLAAMRTGDLVFFGNRPGRPVDDSTLLAALRRLGYGAVTVHGFRSTFRDWCADTGRPSDLAEAALAHAPASKVAGAYQRSDLLELRRGLMQSWADHLTDSVVVALHPAARAG